MTENLPSESIRDLREHLADIVDRVNRDDTPTVITRHGKEVGAIISVDALHQFQRWEEAELNRIVDERMGERQHGVPLDEVITETLERSE